MPLSTSQKALVGQFVHLTQAPEKTAARFLKNTGFKLDAAIDAKKTVKEVEESLERQNDYFAGIDASIAPRTEQLNKMFDSLIRDNQQDNRDVIGVNSAMEYFSSVLGINIENAELLVAFETVQAPSVGVINRKEYVDGWRATGVTASCQSHAEYIRHQILQLPTNIHYFRKVYRHTFEVGKEPGQKALDLENALVYWELLFSSPSRKWRTSSYNWLHLWTRFLKERWTRSVNRDMWNQTFEFAIRTLEDETLSFWTTDGAWPGVIDEFVAWFRDRVTTPNEDTEMET